MRSPLPRHQSSATLAVCVVIALARCVEVSHVGAVGVLTCNNYFVPDLANNDLSSSYHRKTPRPELVAYIFADEGKVE